MTAKIMFIALKVAMVWIVVTGHSDAKDSGYLLSNGLTRHGKNVCEKEASRTVSYQTKKTKLGYSTYKTRCPGWWNWFGWRKCTTKKTITKHYPVVAYREEKGIQLYCCDGWTKNSKNQCLTPTCNPKCVVNQGVCIAPNSCRCIPGWTGDFCNTDVNECDLKNGNCEQTCTNIEGSFDCHCRLGYQKVDKFRCEDIDECATNTHNCHEKANCTNTVGSFNCSCREGYTGNGVTCLELGTTLAPQVNNATNTSQIVQPQLFNDSHKQQRTTLSPQETIVYRGKSTTKESTTITSSPQPSTASVTVYCSGYVPGSDKTERMELISTVAKASGATGMVPEEVVKDINSNLRQSSTALVKNNIGFSVKLFYWSEKESNNLMSNNITGFKTIFRKSPINCTFNKENMNQQMINKSKGVNTSLSWQMALAWTGGVVLFILFAVALVILRAKRKSDWITVVHAPYIYQPFSGANGGNTASEERKSSKRPLLDSDDDYDIRTDDMA